MAFEYTIDLIEGDEVRKYSDESNWYKPEERLEALYAKRMWLVTWTLHDDNYNNYKFGVLKFHEFYTLLTLLEGREIAPAPPKPTAIDPAKLWQFDPKIEDVGKTYAEIKARLDLRAGYGVLATVGRSLGYNDPVQLPPSDGPTKRGWFLSDILSISIGRNMKHDETHYGQAKAWYALDYDGTYGDNLEPWDKVIDIFRAAGIIPIIVTMRFKNEPLEVKRNDVPIIYTGRLSKVDFVHRVAPHDFKFDVWIDDMPHFLLQDAYIAHKGAPLNNQHRLPQYEKYRTTADEFANILNSQLELLKTGWPDYQSA
ncbi:hypothetical protein [Rhizobium phage RHEph12]|nr:hypothetical protein [Rhizobium phage RHEph12]